MPLNWINLAHRSTAPEGDRGRGARYVVFEMNGQWRAELVFKDALWASYPVGMFDTREAAMAKCEQHVNHGSTKRRA